MFQGKKVLSVGLHKSAYFKLKIQKSVSPFARKGATALLLTTFLIMTLLIILNQHSSRWDC